jgi:hypothetical protein
MVIQTLRTERKNSSISTMPKQLVLVGEGLEARVARVNGVHVVSRIPTVEGPAQPLVLRKVAAVVDARKIRWENDTANVIERPEEGWPQAVEANGNGHAAIEEPKTNDFGTRRSSNSGTVKMHPAFRPSARNAHVVYSSRNVRTAALAFR